MYVQQTSYNMKRQNVQNFLSRILFYTGLYVLRFVLLVINWTYVDDVCHSITLLL